MQGHEVILHSSEAPGHAESGPERADYADEAERIEEPIALNAR